MFKKGDKIIYPIYGMSVVKKITDESVGGETVKCYEITFLDSQLDVLVPVDHSQELGLRLPLSRKELLKTLKLLHKRGSKQKIWQDEAFDLEDFAQSKLRTGSVADAIELINIMSEIGKARSKEDKKLNIAETENLKRAKYFVQSEVASVLGERALAKYGLSRIKEE